MTDAVQPEIADIDVDATLDAATSVEGTLYSLVEFDPETFNTLYVSAATRTLYDSEAEMEEHFERIHAYVNIDFTEARLFTEDLFPVADRVRYKATGLDIMTVLRVYLGDEHGLFLGIDAGDPIEPLISELETVFDS